MNGSCQNVRLPFCVRKKIRLRPSLAGRGCEAAMHRVSAYPADFTPHLICGMLHFFHLKIQSDLTFTVENVIELKYYS